ncbi:crossover junction endodeoxyribonuclease RuvC [Sodalis sp. CWE]|uniref:crossover junction endodeoxyribonuclease RuvC n=1 Tax=Sodalis sp. CWE TaxID=2803816 RepID=UPI001C7DBF74|nr:crossover junction endodeoxyribonuclease RuvC [Sodalis sp. CWE]MBX4181230.1 crossover junction endodeoxyribonuclease RuvC [Sodalis sp. CWE]
MSIILGIDPGLHIIGYGILRQDQHKLVHVNSGSIRIKIGNLPTRLKSIYTNINKIIKEFRPNCLAIEQVFMAKYSGAVLKLGQARGAIITAGTNLDLPIFEYAARQIKKTVVGNGAAKKNQIQNMVRILLTLSENPQEDAADALAIAITHCYIRRNNLFQKEAQNFWLRRRRIWY